MWQGSDAQNFCKEWYGKFFTQPEQNSIISVSKTDTAVNLYGINWAASSLSEDRLFFLSVQELADYVGSYTYASILADTEIPYLKAHHDYQEESAADWWLRSPHLTDGNDVGFVNSYGFVDHYNAFTLARARPAFNINRQSVLFTSAATDVKTSADFGDGNISEIPTANTSEWKLTLLDSSRHFSITENTATGKSGGTITLNYSGAATGANEYISLIIEGDSGATHYERIAKPTSASGQVSITIPDNLADGTYTLHVFNEQCNGNERTDYASAFSSVTLTVDNTAPALSNGSAARTDASTGTVKFTSSEAGTYYFAVVEAGAAAPVIDTAGAGTACSNGENTISIAGLTDKAAKDVYVIVKDAAGNVSEALQISLPVFIQTYTIIWKNWDGSVLETDENVPYGTAPSYDGAAPTKPADAQYTYSFAGWSPKVNTVTGDTIYTATFTGSIIRYTIYFDANGGTGTMELQTFIWGEEQSLKPNAFTRDGYTFVMWNTAADGSGENFGDCAMIAAPQNCVLYAQWEEDTAPETYTVTMTTDGNGTASASPASGTSGTEVTLTATPSAGFQFKEWQVISGGVTVANNKFTIGTVNVEIKAIFEQNAPTNTADITVIGQDGSSYKAVHAKLMPLGSTTPLHEKQLTNIATELPEKYLYHATIADGQYNLVVTAVENSTGKEVTVTTLIDVVGHNDTHTAHLPEVGKSSIVNDNSSMGIIAGNVEAVAANYAVTNEGGSLSVTLTTEPGYDPATANHDGLQITQQAIQDRKTIEVELDIDLMLHQYNVDGTETGETNLGDVNTKRLEILIPVNTTGRVPEGFAVYRVHNGELQTLPYGAGDEYFTVDIGGEYVKRCVKRFSSYAIAYGEPEPQEIPNLPQTGDNSHIGLWLAMCFISIAGMIAITMQGKKKKIE